MPDWARDAALIAALATLLNIVTGRIGTAVSWISERFDQARERRESRKSVKTLEQTISLLNQEREIHTRIIESLTMENERLHRNQNGGAQ